VPDICLEWMRRSFVAKIFSRLCVIVKGFGGELIAKNVDVMDLKGELTANFEVWRTSLTSLFIVFLALEEFFFKAASFSLTTCSCFRETPTSFFI
jgi:hypothetical protein